MFLFFSGRGKAGGKGSRQLLQWGCLYKVKITVFVYLCLYKVKITVFVYLCLYKVKITVFVYLCLYQEKIIVFVPLPGVKHFYCVFVFEYFSVCLITNRCICVFVNVCV